MYARGACLSTKRSRKLDDRAFGALIRLSGRRAPPDCWRCGQPGEIVGHGSYMEELLVHWACTCPFCQWECLVGVKQDTVVQGIPKRTLAGD